MPFVTSCVIKTGEMLIDIIRFIRNKKSAFDELENHIFLSKINFNEFFTLPFKKDKQIRAISRKLLNNSTTLTRSMKKCLKKINHFYNKLIQN